tara:strand:- start:127 stop:270 length:144 start_codon:yes stop_codon:yes gene_type:complete
MRYFKKPNGFIVEYDPGKHDLKSFKDRFKEVNEDGSELKPKAKKKKN